MRLRDLRTTSPRFLALSRPASGVILGMRPNTMLHLGSFFVHPLFPVFELLYWVMFAPCYRGMLRYILEGQDIFEGLLFLFSQANQSSPGPATSSQGHGFCPPLRFQPAVGLRRHRSFQGTWRRHDLKRRHSSFKEGSRPPTFVGGVPSWLAVWQQLLQSLCWRDGRRRGRCSERRQVSVTSQGFREVIATTSCQ